MSQLNYKPAIIAAARRAARAERKERRRTGEEPEGDERVEDHAAERGRRHERPDRVAPEVMDHVPCGMHEPR